MEEYKQIPRERRPGPPIRRYRQAAAAGSIRDNDVNDAKGLRGTNSKMKQLIPQFFDVKSKKLWLPVTAPPTWSAPMKPVGAGRCWGRAGGGGGRCGVGWGN